MVGITLTAVLEPSLGLGDAFENLIFLAIATLALRYSQDPAKEIPPRIVALQDPRDQRLLDILQGIPICNYRQNLLNRKCFLERFPHNIKFGPNALQLLSRKILLQDLFNPRIGLGIPSILQWYLVDRLIKLACHSLHSRLLFR